ncbi:unnamed protein product [Gemmata massiliana]|uniref:Uncharacterized protein n=1 Tax=Gemmata massiliana TaxID=1210884 RepID=A0A6P2D497_9BACT|nr:hypothetical protein [Gemmata massiliana]VTR95255.1 unnamed protein product [Gemmata massiliana]
MSVALEQLIAFVQLVRKVRDAQVIYRRTIDARLRHALPLMEQQLDTEALLLEESLRRDAELLAIAEGGGA